MVIQPRSCRRLPVQGDHGAIFTDSIDVCAVAIIGDALYKDIRLSGNQVRETWARRPYRWARGGGAGGGHGGGESGGQAPLSVGSRRGGVAGTRGEEARCCQTIGPSPPRETSPTL